MQKCNWFHQSEKFATKNDKFVFLCFTSDRCKNLVQRNRKIVIGCSKAKTRKVNVSVFSVKFMSENCNAKNAKDEIKH